MYEAYMEGEQIMEEFREYQRQQDRVEFLEPEPLEALVLDELVPVPAVAQGAVNLFADLRPATDKTSSKFYMFTCVRGGDPSWQQPAVLGRLGLWNSIVSAYGAVFPEDHACRNGPLYGKVVLEQHADGDPHLHAACCFPDRHRWKAVEKHLRTVLKVKAGMKRLVLNSKSNSYCRTFFGRQTSKGAVSSHVLADRQTKVLYCRTFLATEKQKCCTVARVLA